MSITNSNENSSKARQILNRFLLKFENAQLELEYNEQFKEYMKKLNYFLASFTLILTMIILIWIHFKEEVVTEQFMEKGIEAKKLTVELMKINCKELEEFIFNNNYLVFKKNYLESVNFTEEYLIKLQNNETLRDLVLIRNEDESYNKIIFSYLLILDLWVIAPIFGILELCILLISIPNKNFKINVISFCILLILFSFNFHFITAMIKTFYENSSDPTFFIVIIHLFLLIMFNLKSRACWLPISVSNIIVIILECSFYDSILLDHNFHTFQYYYLVIIFLIRILLVIISYNNIFYIKMDFYLRKISNYKKEYLMNFVDNMSQGFISYSNTNILFANKSMEKIIKNFKDYNSDYINNNLDNILISHSQVDLLKKEENIKNNNENTQKNANNNSKFWRNYSNNEYYNNNKINLEKIFNFISQINEDLPIEIYKKIQEDLSNNKIFDLEEFYRLLIKQKKQNNNYNDFIFLGIIKIENSDSNKPNDKIIKTYQVLFRIITHEYEDDYLEIMFSDVSKIIDDEREKTLSNARSMYLNKIAHEFRNPLTSLMELSQNIKDDINNNIKNEKNNEKNNTFNKIYQSIDYSEKLYITMIHYLKDFSVFSNLKFSCEKSNNKCEKFIKCYQCGLCKMCEKCQVCNYCEEKLIHSFEYKFVIDEILETFNSLCKYENKNISKISLENIYNPNGNENDITNNTFKRKYLKTNKELFSSAFFNLIYHSYKCANIKTEIKIKIKNETQNLCNITHFEIINQGMEIDNNFIKLINQKEKINYEYNNKEEDDEIKSNSFNKNFELYIAFCILRKLDSNLKIESGNNCSVYSFSINTKEQEVLYHSKTINYLPIDGNKFSPICSKINISKVNTTNQFLILKPLKKISEKTLNKETNSFQSNYTKIYNSPMIYKHEEINSNLDIELEYNLDTELPNNLDQISSIINENKDEIKIDIINSPISSPKRIINILVIDDENLIRKTLIRHFKKIQKRKEIINFEIEEATNCLEAINKIYLNYLDNKFFDLIIIDEYMPYVKGSTFIKFLKQFQVENNQTKSIIISHTAFDTIEKKKYIYESGADYILGKPVEFTEFEDFIMRLI